MENRQLLEERLEFKPDWANYAQGKKDGRDELLAELEGQEPVAWANINAGFRIGHRVVYIASEKQQADKYHEHCYDLTPLYARPVPACAAPEDAKPEGESNV